MQPYEYPSPLVNVTFQRKNGERHAVSIPQAEKFRVDSIFRRSEYKLAGLSSEVRPKIIIDIGANVGLFALYFKLNEPDSVIHCYEPAPSTVALLRDNTDGLAGIHIHPYALGRETGEVAMHLHRSNTGQNALQPIEGSAAYSGTTLVDCRSAAEAIDELKLQRIDVIKIDTEGSEIDILESLGSRVDLSDYVLLEFHSEEDRRAVDRYVSSFVLYGGSVTAIGRGTLKYVHRRLVPAKKAE